MKARRFVHFIRYGYQNFPLRINAFALFLFIFLIYRQIQSISTKDSTYIALIWLMAKLSLIMLLILVGISVLINLLAWLNFRRLNQKGAFVESITVQGTQNKHSILFDFPKTYMPLLGYIDARLYFNHSQTELLRLHSIKKFLSKYVKALVLVKLDDVKVYNIHRCRLYCKDMFQLTALPLDIQFKKDVYNHPSPQNAKDIKSAPQKTEELAFRIEELKKSEGEWLHYKNFEHNDDIRRIVWKIFARNKELLVRTPEIFNPYASTINIFASFAYTYFLKSELLNRHFLNIYKNLCYTIYKEISKSDFSIDFRTDQPFHAQHIDFKQDVVSAKLSAADWQSQTKLNDTVMQKNLAGLILSSLTDPADLEQCLASLNRSTLIYFIPLSTYAVPRKWSSLLKKIFIQSPEPELKLGLVEWTDKQKLKQQEAQLLQILNNGKHKFAVVA